jgi:hypothetical protein
VTRFFELAGQALFGVAFLAPVTWPLLIAAAIAWFGQRRQREGLTQNRTRLIVSAAIQSFPSVAILICGVLDSGRVTGSRPQYEDLVLLAFLAQLPIAAISFWWCQRARRYTVATALAWAAFSVSAAFVVNLSGHPL